MANTMKLNIGKATVRQLFKAVVKATDQINETFIHGQTKCRLQIQPSAHGSEFYVPNIFKDQILLTKNSHSNSRGWADQALVNNSVDEKPLELSAAVCYQE